MTVTHTKRKWVIITSVSILSLLVIAGIVFYYLIDNNIKKIISEIVQRESKGSLAVNMRKFKFSWATNKLEVGDFELYSADSISAQTSYRIKIENFNIKTNSLWDIAVHKKLNIDSLSIVAP